MNVASLHPRDFIDDSTTLPAAIERARARFPVEHGDTVQVQLYAPRYLSVMLTRVRVRAVEQDPAKLSASSSQLPKSYTCVAAICAGLESLWAESAVQSYLATMHALHHEDRLPHDTMTDIYAYLGDWRYSVASNGPPVRIAFRAASEFGSHLGSSAESIGTTRSLLGTVAMGLGLADHEGVSPDAAQRARQAADDLLAEVGRRQKFASTLIAGFVKRET